MRLTISLAALALASAAGVPLAPMLHGLREYRGEPHRVEFIRKAFMATMNDPEYLADTKKAKKLLGL